MHTSSTDDPPPPPDTPDDAEVADLAEGVEYLGTYLSLEHYLRAVLVPELAPGVAWLLDYVDYERVLGRFEGGVCTYFWAEGHVFRVVRSARE